MKVGEFPLDPGEEIGKSTGNLVVTNYRAIDLQSERWVDLRDVTSVDWAPGWPPPKGSAVFRIDGDSLGATMGIMAGVSDVWEARRIVDYAQSGEPARVQDWDSWDHYWFLDYWDRVLDSGFFTQEALDYAAHLLDALPMARYSRIAAKELLDIVGAAGGGGWDSSVINAEFQSWGDRWESAVG